MQHQSDAVHASDASQQLVNVAHASRRTQSLAACTACRRSKLKCDGQRPCARCRRRDVECRYTTRENETVRQARIRQQDETERDAAQLRYTLQQVTDAQDDNAALAILRNIRDRGRLRPILQGAQGLMADRVVYTSELYRLQVAFLLSMMQSTADLDSIASCVARVLGPGSQFKLPAAAVYGALRDKLVTSCKMQQLLDIANGRVIEPKPTIDAMYNGAPIWVPAAPWTLLLHTDEEMSHLISLFCSCVNAYAWFVEENAFIWAMRSRDAESVFCSPLLVHAVLALTSLFSEAQGVFVQEDNYLSRGEHFQEEAYRLWRLENEVCTITNVQALLLLAVSCTLRGQDAKGIHFLHEAVKLEQGIVNAFGDKSARSSVDEAIFTRVRQSVALSVVCLEVTWHLSYFQPCQTPAEKIAALLTVVADFPDPLLYRQQYPFGDQPSPFEWKTLQQYRVQLTQFVSEGLQTKVNANNDARIPSNASRVQAFLQRFSEWYSNLDVAVRYSSRASVPLMEFHAHCLSVMMILVDGLLKKYVTDPASKLDKGWQELQNLNTRLAVMAGIVSRDYRLSYGIKITLPYMFHMVSVASFRLIEGLRNLKDEEVTSTPDGWPLSTSNTPPDVATPGPATLGSDAWPRADGKTAKASVKREEILSALEQCFRCLLGAGFHYLLARGVAQSVYVTALDMGVDLPDSIKKLLNIAASSSWNGSDLRDCDINYPNYTVHGDGASWVPEEAQMIRWARRYVAVMEQDAGRSVGHI